ncbi:MAG: rod shape-determining protein MreD, partial [Bacteroidetes bacterium]
MLQGLIINNIHIGKATPFLYIYPLLLLPVTTPLWAAMLTAFVYGIYIDSFSHTIGMHVFSAVALMYIRNFILNIMLPRESMEPGMIPNVKNRGWSWFLTYASILIFIHHLILFNVESWNLSEFFVNLYKTVICGIFTLSLIA